MRSYASSTMKFFRWIGLFIGWITSGFFGGVIGFFLGSFIDSLISGGKTQAYNAPQGAPHLNPFTTNLTLLVSAVLKADGKVMQSELEFVKSFYLRNFGADITREAMLFLRDALQKEIPLYSVCMNVRTQFNPAANLELLHLLFGIAAADGNISASELSIIEQIAGYLNISAGDFNSVKAMFSVKTDREWAYKVLEIDRTATNEEVKKAHRKMALKHHPDKVAQMGEDVQRAANEKFRKVQEAYEAIKKERKMP